MCEPFGLDVNVGIDWHCTKLCFLMGMKAPGITLKRLFIKGGHKILLGLGRTTTTMDDILKCWEMNEIRLMLNDNEIICYVT